jgi:hypothetical protein
MPADIDRNADPNAKARCPRYLLPGGLSRCRALVLVRDADEHEAWHDELEEVLTALANGEHEQGEVVEWPERAEDDEPIAGRPGL